MCSVRLCPGALLVVANLGGAQRVLFPDLDSETGLGFCCSCLAACFGGGVPVGGRGGRCLGRGVLPEVISWWVHLLRAFGMWES